jgi:hypothetical protein
MQSEFESLQVRPQSAGELKDYVRHNAIDLRQMSLQQFRIWLQARIDEASTQEPFRLRCRIREVRTVHRRRIKDRERRLDAARRAYESLPATVEFERSAREVDSLNKGVLGLKVAVSEGRADPEKLLQFEQRLIAAEAGLAEARAALNTPEKRRLDRAKLSLDRLLEEVGLAKAEAQLDQNFDLQGSASTIAGTRFEMISSLAAGEFIIPKLGLVDQKAVILHGATLDCPQGELDQIVVTEEKNGIAKVHAVVEAKNNINDLAHGFRVRQENLAWFVGDSHGFNSTRYRTSRFRDGQYDGRIVQHHENGGVYRFDATSFDLFRELDCPPYRMKRLFFVTECRPLLGLGGGDLSRLMHRVATDYRFDIRSDAKLKRLYESMLETLPPVQTIDVLRLYASDDSLAGNIIMAQVV